MTEDFQPHKECIIIVYDRNGKEIDHFDGTKQINGSDYADRLPITYKQIEITTTVLNVVRIDAKGTE